MKLLKNVVPHREIDSYGSDYDDEDDDDDNMEANYDEIEDEEEYSRYVANKEDQIEYEKILRE